MCVSVCFTISTRSNSFFFFCSEWTRIPLKCGSIIFHVGAKDGRPNDDEEVGDLRAHSTTSTRWYTSLWRPGPSLARNRPVDASQWQISCPLLFFLFAIGSYRVSRKCPFFPPPPPRACCWKLVSGLSMQWSLKRRVYFKKKRNFFLLV